MFPSTFAQNSNLQLTNTAKHKKRSSEVPLAKGTHLSPCCARPERTRRTCAAQARDVVRHDCNPCVERDTRRPGKMWLHGTNLGVRR